MFGKKREIPTIDKQQLELIETAQKRIKQKKQLFAHVLLFVIGSALLAVVNLLLGFGEQVTLFEKPWVVYVIFGWLFLLIYHVFNVYITHKFLGKAWEQRQINKLVDLQKERIAILKQDFILENDKVNPSDLRSTEVKNSKNKTAHLTIIAAAGEDNAIGKDNDLIWHLSNDLKRFKQLTDGHHIIMGRKTFESFPKPLPNRTHIVITRQDNYKVPDGVVVVHNLADALDAARSDASPFIIGGGDIYKQAMPLADVIELTQVHAKFDNADTFFPEIDQTIWKKTAKRTYAADEKHQYPYSFITYKRA